MKSPADELFVNTYGTKRIRMVRGKGCMLWDERGKSYLDFFGGIAVNALGYGGKVGGATAKLMAKQYRSLPHISNLYTTTPAIRLANMILAHQPIPNRVYKGVFFSNSGAEANEAALKFAALYIQHERHRAPQFTAFRNAFHGRTFLTLSLTTQKKYSGMYTKIFPKIFTLPYNDINALHDKLTANTGALIVETVQGEGGMHTMSYKFALLLNRICASNDIILIADEVQTGLGRTGMTYSSEVVGLQPDIITIAKPLGGGLPLAATIVTEKVNAHITPGIHGSTFGGGPVQCTVAAEVWRRVVTPAFLTHVQRMSKILDEELMKLASNRPVIKELRGLGLLRGIRLRNSVDLKEVIANLRTAGMLVVPSGESVIRLAPPLIVGKLHIAEAINILDQVLSRY